MSKRPILGIFCAIAVMASAAYAFDYKLTNFDFVAPTVPSTSAAPNQVGLIVYDSTNKVFWGRSSDVAPNDWQQLSPITSAVVPSGSILPFAGTTAPSGYLLCDGSVVSRTTYAALFAVIGTAFGSGDGSTTFNVPDFRGRFLRGLDGTANRDPDHSSRGAMNTGGNTGNNMGSIQSDIYAAHTHTFPVEGTVSGSSNLAMAGQGGASTGSPATTSASGGSETRPINAYVNYIIKI